jgi:hypothetical protein
VVNNGSKGVVCPQVDPAWLVIAEEFIPAYLEGLPFNLTAAVAQLENSTAPPPAPDPRTTEDCLFLDVYAPQKVFEQAGQGCGAPVLVWIYGGGYANGDKNNDGEYNPAGLIKASQAAGNEGVVFVALNYRVITPPAVFKNSTDFQIVGSFWLPRRTYITVKWHSKRRILRSALGPGMGAAEYPPLWRRPIESDRVRRVCRRRVYIPSNNRLWWSERPCAVSASSSSISGVASDARPRATRIGLPGFPCTAKREHPRRSSSTALRCFDQGKYFTSAILAIWKLYIWTRGGWTLRPGLAWQTPSPRLIRQKPEYHGWPQLR